LSLYGGAVLAGILTKILPPPWPLTEYAQALRVVPKSMATSVSGVPAGLFSGAAVAIVVVGGGSGDRGGGTCAVSFWRGGGYGRGTYKHAG